MKPCVIVFMALVVPLAGCRERESEPEQAVSIVAEETITLTPRFQVGESAVYLHTEFSQQGQVSALHTVTREIRESRRFRLETLETEPGGVSKLRFTMERVTSSVVDNGETVFEFDSQIPTNDMSGPARVRGLLGGLVAEMTIAPGGTVLSMAANLTPDDLAGIPVSQHPLLAENWFRSAIESLYRPFGDESTLSLTESRRTSGPPVSPFLGDEHSLVRDRVVTGVSDSTIQTETTTTLYTLGEARPESYSGITQHQWIMEAGCLESFRQRQVVRIERPIAGTPGLDTAVREISLVRVNPGGSDDDKEER